MNVQGVVDQYTLRIKSPTDHTSVGRSIYCMGSFGTAFLIFLPDDEPLQESQKREGRNVFDVYYRLHDWDAIVDILRNESPVYFFFDQYNRGTIGTSREEVGEEES